MSVGRPKKGDLVRVPLVDGVVALGQIIKMISDNVLLAVFPDNVAELTDSELAQLPLDEPALLIETVAPFVTSTSWQIGGRRPVSKRISLPVYKVPVGFGGDHYLQDVEGNLIRPATAEEVRVLRPPRSFSAAVVEDALRALHGLAQWQELFDDMRPVPQ